LAVRRGHASRRGFCRTRSLLPTARPRHCPRRRSSPHLYSSSACRLDRLRHAENARYSRLPKTPKASLVPDVIGTNFSFFR
jgi:hypothetical protein